MKSSAKTALLMGVALIALSACSGTKGPGELGSKNDIVVRNHGEAREAAPAGDFSSTVETAVAVPAAEVGQGEPLAPVDGAPVATQAEAQAVADQSAPVPSTTAAPINDGTPSVATAPVQQNTAAETPVPAQPVNQTTTPVAPAAQASTPVLQAEPYATPRAQQPGTATSTTAVSAASSAPATTSATQQPYVSVAEGESVSATEQPVPPQAQPVAQAAPVQEPAPVAVPKNPNGSFYEYMKAGQSSGSTTTATTSAPVTTNGDVSKVKAALTSKGLYSGAQNDAVDSEFLNALAKYQGENGLPMGGVNVETKQHLGIAQ